MVGHTNVYKPYERRAPNHEDNLTRAFLVVLRAVPVAHAAWLSLVRAGHREQDGSPRCDDYRVPDLHELPAWSIETQTRGVPEGASRLISVLQTDEHYFRGADANASSRRQVLDGTVAYGDELVIAIENKPYHGNVWDGQLEVNVPEGVAHDARVACVRWRDIVRSWAKLLQAEALGPAERILVGDFLEFTEEYFPQLWPFATLRMCGRSEFRLNRRIRTLLTETALGPVENAPGWGWYLSLPSGVGNVALRVALIAHVGDSARLEVQVAPADKVGQSRLFHRTFTEVDLVALQGLGWEVRPNFHLSYMQSHVFYARGELGLLEYFAFWKAGVDCIGRRERGSWEALWRELRAASVVADADRATFDRAFTETARDFAVVVPGYLLSRSISLAEAVALDERNVLSDALARQVRAMAKVLRLTFAA